MSLAISGTSQPTSGTWARNRWKYANALWGCGLPAQHKHNFRSVGAITRPNTGHRIDGALHHPCLLPPWRSLYRVQQLSILG